MRTGIEGVDRILICKELHEAASNKNDALWNALIELAHQINDLKKELTK